MKRAASILLLVAFACILMQGCAGDPRKNCNHPQHGQYMSEKLNKKRGIKF